MTPLQRSNEYPKENPYGTSYQNFPRWSKESQERTVKEDCIIQNTDGTWTDVKCIPDTLSDEEIYSGASYDEGNYYFICDLTGKRKIQNEQIEGFKMDLITLIGPNADGATGLIKELVTERNEHFEIVNGKYTAVIDFLETKIQSDKNMWNSTLEKQNQDYKNTINHIRKQQEALNKQNEGNIEIINELITNINEFMNIKNDPKAYYKIWKEEQDRIDSDKLLKKPPLKIGTTNFIPEISDS